MVSVFRKSGCENFNLSQEKVDPERNILNYKLQMDTFSPHAHS